MLHKGVVDVVAQHVGHEHLKDEAHEGENDGREKGHAMGLNDG